MKQRYKDQTLQRDPARGGRMRPRSTGGYGTDSFDKGLSPEPADPDGADKITQQYKAQMIRQKLTPWYPDGTEPARPGVYQVKWGWERPTVTVYARWDGRWYWCHRTVEMASHERHGSTWLSSMRQWRGLREKA